MKTNADGNNGRNVDLDNSGANAFRRMKPPAQEKIDAVKLELCYAIDRAIARQMWTYAEAAFWMGTSKANVSRVVNKRTNRLTVGQLVKYLAVVCPHFRFMVSIDS